MLSHRCRPYEPQPSLKPKPELRGGQIWTRDWAGIMDPWSRRVSRLTLAERLRTELVGTAIRQARTRHQPANSCLHHSHRSGQWPTTGIASSSLPTD